MEVDTSEKYTRIEDVKIIVTVERNTSNELIAQGKVINNGKLRIFPPWFIKASFYKTKNFRQIMGKAETRITYSLDPNETTGWEIRFSSSEYNEYYYPNFRVADLQAFYVQSD